jgi:hypothetical protein
MTGCFTPILQKAEILPQIPQMAGTDPDGIYPVLCHFRDHPEPPQAVVIF